jgi:hypothetical protein
MTSLFIGMAQAVGAEKGERAEARLSYCSGYYAPKPGHPSRKLELRVSQGVSTRKVKAKRARAIPTAAAR